jgi:ParB family chromosome partitioning protein
MAKKQSLQGKRLNSFGMDPTKLVVIGLDVQVPKDHELWELYDPRIEKPLVERTVRDMMRHGVDMDVLVRKYKFLKGTVVWGKPLKEDTELPVVVDGRRRTQHSREANVRLAKEKEPLIVVPVKVFKGSVRDAGLRSVALNEHREDDDVLMKARKAKVMLDRIKNEEDVAEHFNVSVDQLRAYFRLLEANPSVVKAVEKGEIPPSSAIRLAKLPPDHQKVELEDAIAKGETSKAQIEARVRRRVAESKGAKKSELPGSPPTRRELTAMLRLVRENESDLVDTFESVEQAVIAACEFFLNGIASNTATGKLLAHLRKKAEEADKAEKSKKSKPAATAVEA